MWRRTHLKYLIACWYILFWNSVIGQPKSRIFEEIGIDNGLSSNYPNCIIQDEKGFIWVGTNNGLNRYDGYQSKVYNHDPANSNSISNNWISALLEDSKGNIWIGTEGGGLNLYTPSTGKFRRFRFDIHDSTSLNSNIVMQLYEDSRERIWVGTKDGLNLINLKDFTCQQWKQPKACTQCNHSVLAITEDHMGNLWIGDEFDGLYYFVPSSGTFSRPHLSYKGSQKLPSQFINDLHFKKGFLWVGTDNGLAILNTLSEEYVNLSQSNKQDLSISDAFVRQVYEAPDGEMWLCTNGSGLINFNRESNEIKVYGSDHKSSYRLGSNSIADVLVDHSNNVWIATRGGGLNKFNLKSLIFKHWEKESNNPNSLANNEVRAIHQDHDGTIWLGTNDGLSRLDPSENGFRNYVDDFVYKADIRTPRIRVIYRSINGTLWVGTQNGGLYRYDKAHDRFLLEKPFIEDPKKSAIRDIGSIFEREDGILWLGTIGTGFVTYDLNKSTVTLIENEKHAYDILPTLTVNCTLRESEDEWWIGSNRGLVLINTSTLDYQSWKQKPGCDTCIVGDKIRALYKDSNNKLWIGTRTGLSIFDRVKDEFQQLTIDDGLPSNIIFGILLGIDGNLWLTTPNGLSRISPGSMEVKNIAIPQNNILDMGGHAQGLDGQLLVGGIAGFTVFHPNDLKVNPYVPEVVFTDFKIDNFSPNLEKDISELHELNLDHDQINLTFEFAALEFTNSTVNQYKYKLEGFNEKWVDYKNKHDVTFTNLAPKQYILKIKGSNSDGVWNEQPQAIMINISPPWWDTWIFKILAIIVVIGSAFSFYKIRINGLRRQERVLKREVFHRTKELYNKNDELEKLHKEKDGIIKIVAHDLKAPLSNIHGFSHLLSYSKHLNKQEKEYVDLISKSVELGNSLIMDLLFVSNISHPEKRINAALFEVSNFIREWQMVYKVALEKKNQNIKLYLGEQPITAFADMKMMTRVLDNLMTNAMKFSPRGSQIDISLTENDQNVFISCRDYGPGMSEKDKEQAFGMFQKLSARPTEGEDSHGLGLAIVKTLLDKMNGTIKIVSKTGTGCEFIVGLPKSGNNPAASAFQDSD